MPRIDEAILEYIRRNGPSTPIEIAQRLGADSIIVSAVLVDAASQNRLLKSKKKIGSMKYYYFPDQLTLLQKKIADFLTPLDKELLQRLMRENVIGEFELKPEEIITFSNLEDLIGGIVLDLKGTPVRYWYSPSIPESQAREIGMQKLEQRFGKRETAAKVEKALERPREITQLQKVQEELVELVERGPPPPQPLKEKKRKKKTKAVEEEKAPESEFKNNVYGWLEKQNIEVLRERATKRGKEAELDVKVPTPLGKQNYIVRILDSGKKQASQSDISSIGMEAVTRRTPVIIISSGGFAKGARKYWEKELQDLVILVSKEDLE